MGIRNKWYDMTAIEKPEDSEKARKEEITLPQETLEVFGGDELRSRVFYEKYALRDASGMQVEKTPDQLWLRVARELASVEDAEKKKEWTDKFYWLLEDFKFVPGGRILFGAGQPRRATLLNCYFFKIKEDSIEAIFDWCKEAARTYSFGGGVGTDISVLRPRGSPVNNSAIYDSVNDRMTIFGGYNGGAILSDVWILSGASGHNGAASWTQDVSGQPRRFSSSLYDSTSNEMITFGGETSTNPLNPSSDIYTLTNANGLP